MKRVLVLTGDGINCEGESARAFEAAGASPQILHVNELLSKPTLLLEYSIFCIPGGFSFGDELRSGKILAEKMRVVMADVFKKFTENGGLTIGVCNGFQVLIQLGAFMGLAEKRKVTLATNSHGKFMDRWVEVEVQGDAIQTPWFKGVRGRLMLPIRHKEGRIVMSEDADPTSFQIPMRYLDDVNGSFEQAAALLDSTGQILGLMPHPEAATHGFLNPLVSEFKEENANRVRQIFKNAVEWKKEV